MIDNSDVQVLRNGIITDYRIETVMGHLYNEIWDAPDLGQLYLELIQEFLQAEFIDGPDFKILIDPDDTFQCDAFDGYVISSLVDGLSLDIVSASDTSIHWPGDFSYLADARLAVSLYNRLSDTWTAFIPGLSLTHAIFIAVMQLCREISEEHYNQPELELPKSH